MVSKVDPRFYMVNADSIGCKEVPKSSNATNVFIRALSIVLL